MKLYLKDFATGKLHLIKGFTVEQYNSGKYEESELFTIIYELLDKHDIKECALTDSKGKEL